MRTDNGGHNRDEFNYATNIEFVVYLRGSTYLLKLFSVPPPLFLPLIPDNGARI